MKDFSGVWVAMVSPWDHVNHTPRKETIRKLIEHFLRAGVNGLFILGTTGEGLLLTPEERMEFTEAVLEAANGHLPVIVHTGHIQTSVVVELSIHARRMGAAGIAVSAPGYYKLDAEELRMHFITVADAVGNFPIFLYDIPDATGTLLSGKLLVALHEERANIVGAKVSRNDWAGWQSYIAHVDRTIVFVGTDSMCFPLLLMGARGIVSGPANLLPKTYIQLYKAVREGNWRKGREIQEVINQLCQVCHYGNPLSFIKEGMELLGWDVGSVFHPLRPLYSEERKTLYKELTSLVNAGEGDSIV